MQRILSPRTLSLLGCALVPLLMGPGAATEEWSRHAPQGVEERKFTHWRHVRIDWFRGRGAEVPRDCRGCHDYSRGEPRDPQEVCFDCHRANVSSGQATLAIPPQALERWRNLTRNRDHSRTFSHRDHKELECRHCHKPVSGGGGLGTSDELQRLAGTGACVSCHDPVEKAVPGQTAGKPEQVAAFAARLNERLKGKPETSFDHRQHLTRKVATGTDAPQVITCMPCHKPLSATPSRLIGHAGIDKDACATCHRTKDSASKIDFGFTDEQVSSPTRLSFVHQPHLSAEALKEGELSKGCLACHQRGLAPDGLHWPLQERWATPNQSTYIQCESCHSHKKKANAVGLDHRGNFADPCATCHVVSGGEGSLKDQRPTVIVQRPKAGRRFAITSQAHPFVTGLKTDQACRECHRANIPRLPSRLGSRPFSHATHLSPEPEAKECKKCHSGLEGVASPESMSLYDPLACKACHLGEEVPDPFALERSEKPEKPEKRAVPLFPHARHLSKEARQNPKLGERACLVCHGPEDGQWTAEIGYKTDIARCTTCHNHKDKEASRITSGKTREYIESCKACHGASLPDPRSEGTEQNLRAAVTRAFPAPHHPLPAEQPCKTCHVAAWTFFKNELGDPTAVERFSGVHKDPVSRYSEAGECARCHWSDALMDQKRRGDGITKEQLFEQLGKVITYGAKR